MWSLLDIIFPCRSLRDAQGGWISREEMQDMQVCPMRLDRSALRALGIQHLETLVAAGEYGASKLLRTAIHRFKYDRVAALGGSLGSVLLRAAPLLVAPSSTVLCPVPLHWIRRYHRGFNQACLLAEFIGQARGWEVKELLRRTRYTLPQAKRATEQRRGTMHHAFAAVRRGDVPEHVVLIDDVCTTGATLDACADALMQAGVRQVEGLVLAFGGMTAQRVGG